MGLRVFQYSLGAAVAQASTIRFTELASDGDPAAKSILTFPGASPPFPPIVYFTNPDIRRGFDNDSLLLPPSSTLTKTLSSHVLTSFENTIEDRIIEEVWTAEGGKLSMPTGFWRELRNYNENRPDPEVDGFITWQPRNQGSKTYEIQIVHLTAGGDNMLPQVAPEFKPIGGGGSVGGQVIAGPDGDLDVMFASSGWQTEEIVLRFRLISELP